jgi:hypothetical protein
LQRYFCVKRTTRNRIVANIISEPITNIRILCPCCIRNYIYVNPIAAIATSWPTYRRKSRYYNKSPITIFTADTSDRKHDRRARIAISPQAEQLNISVSVEIVNRLVKRYYKRITLSSTLGVIRNRSAKDPSCISNMRRAVVGIVISVIYQYKSGRVKIARFFSPYGNAYIARSYGLRECEIKR